MCSPTKVPYIPPSIRAVFAGVTAVVVWESPDQALGFAKLLAIIWS